MNNIYRYSINDGAAGGIVFADTISNARIILKNKYKKDFEILENDDGNPDFLKVWKWAEDEYYDKDYLDVVECYGL